MISNIKNKSFFYYNLHNLVKIYVHEDISHHLKDDIDFQVGEFLIGKEQFQKDKVSESIFVIPYNFKKIILNEGNFKVVDFHKSKGEISTFFEDVEENLAVYKEDNNFVIFSDTSNFLINVFIQYLLIHKGYSMIHAAGYLNSNGKVNIVTGAGGIGKTAILGYAIKNKKLRYLGDDIIIIGKNQVSFSFPRKFVFKKYHKKIYKDVFKEDKIKYFNFYYLKKIIFDMVPFKRALKKFLKKINIYNLILKYLYPHDFLATISPKKIFPENSYLESGPIEKIIFLDRGNVKNFEISDLSNRDFSSRTFSVLMNEWTSYSNQIFNLGALNVFNLPFFYKRNIEIFEEISNQIVLKNIIAPRNCSVDELNNFLDEQGLF